MNDEDVYINNLTTYGTIDPSSITIVDNTWTDSINIRPSNEPTIQISEGNVKIGDLEMSVEHLELCLKHLMKLTKDEHPEEFI